MNRNIGWIAVVMAHVLGVLTSSVVGVKEARAEGGPPIPEAQTNCACTQTAAGSAVPCEIEIRFVSFTPTDAPFGDQEGEYAFHLDFGLVPHFYNFTSGTGIGEDATHFVNEVVRTVQVPCGETVDVLGLIEGAETDAANSILDFVNADEHGAATLPLSLQCLPGAPVQQQSVNLELSAHGRVRHKVRLDFDIRFKNPPCGDGQDSSCPPVTPDGYDQTPLPCTFDLYAVAFKHVDAPGTDQNGEFSMYIEADGATQSTSFSLHEGDTTPLSMDRLAHIEVPCGQTVTVPITGSIHEGDVFVNDAGFLSSSIELSCPATPVGGEVKTFPVKLYGKNGKGKYRNEVELSVAVEPGNANGCVVPPLPPTKYPCEFTFYMTTVEHTDSPTFDKNGEFYFEASFNGEMGSAWSDKIHKGSTATLNDELVTIGVPCGESRSVTMNLSASERDDDFLGITNADEQAFASENFTLTCPPTPEVLQRVYALEFRNRKGKVKHKAVATIEQRLENWALACSCVAAPPESCDLDVTVKSFTHDATSIGDDPADFYFDLYLDDQVVHPVGGGSLTVLSLGIGDTATIDTPLEDAFGTNLLGTYYQSFVRLPVAMTHTVGIHVEGSEEDSFASSDTGAGEGIIELSCQNPYQQTSVPISFHGKRKVKHSGTLVFETRPH